jgi:hypothetical protein
VQNIWKCERGEGEGKMRWDRAEEIGQGPFSTDSSDEPVQKTLNEPVLMFLGRLGKGTGTNTPFSTGS